MVDMNMRKPVVSEWVSLDGVFDADTMEQWFGSPHHHGKRKAFLQRQNGYDEAEACQNQNVQLGGHSALLPANQKLTDIRVWRGR